MALDEVFGDLAKDSIEAVGEMRVPALGDEDEQRPKKPSRVGHVLGWVALTTLVGLLLWWLVWQLVEL